MQRFVQRSRRLAIPDRLDQALRRPARGDLIGEDADAVASLLRTITATLERRRMP